MVLCSRLVVPEDAEKFLARSYTIPPSPFFSHYFQTI